MKMKTHTTIFIILFIGFFSTINGQEEKLAQNFNSFRVYSGNVSKNKIKYGIVFQKPSGKNYANQKKQLLLFLSNLKDIEYIDKRAKFAFFDNEIMKRQGNLVYSTPDTISSIFKIDRITKKKNNYQQKGNKLVKRNVYLIDVLNVDSIIQNPQFIQLFSVETSDTKGKKLKVGKQYEMTIYSYFKDDCCSPIEEDSQLIYRIRKPGEHLCSVLFENIWVVNVDLVSFNLFGTNNLNGLYYVK